MEDRFEPASAHDPGRVVAWLLASNEPGARWITHTALLGGAAGDATVEAERRAVLDDAGTRELIARLPDWESGGKVSGHDSPSFGPNLMCFLARMGVRAGDSGRIDATIEAMLRHQTEEGRFATFVVNRASPAGDWSALLCDTHAITEALVRFGRADHPAVARSVERMAADLAETGHGRAWPCLPSLGFRGPGRKGEPCPQVTAEALRVCALLPRDRRPAVAIEGAWTLLEVWRRRGTSQPYMFGHGYRFKTVKWPPFWYSALEVVEALGGYPELWRGPDARPEDRRSIVELVASLAAYNLDADGRVTPVSCYRGFEAFSFGQKKLPSPLATALVHAALRPFDDLAAEVAALDLTAIGSSKGGSGTPRPPKPAS